MKTFKTFGIIMVLAVTCFIVQAQVPAGQVDYWPLDGRDNFGLWPDLVGTNPLSQMGVVTVGPSGGAFFDGAGSGVLECAGSPTFSQSNGVFTVSAWVYINGVSALGDHQCIVSKGYAEDNQWALLITGDLKHVWFNFGPGLSLYSRLQPPIGQWFLVTAWVDQNAKRGMQVNTRKPDLSVAGNFVYQGTDHDLVVGAWNWSWTNLAFLNGGVHNLRYWNRVLTQTERNQLYKAGF